MNCPTHQVPFRTVPAGVSKSTGRPYQAFEACPERGCKEKPPKGYAAPHAGGSGGFAPAPELGMTRGQGERIIHLLEKIAGEGQ